MISVFHQNEITKYKFDQNSNVFYLKNFTDEEKKILQKKRLVWKIFQSIYIFWIRYYAKFKKKSGNYNFIQAYFLNHKIISGNILDIGGGGGNYIKFWTNKKNQFYIVHDPVIEKIRIEKKNAYFVQGFAENLPYKNRIFDIVLISSAIDHFADLSKSLNELDRCLKKNGKIFVVHKIDNKKTNLIKTHIRQLSENQIIVNLQKIGCKLIKTDIIMKTEKYKIIVIMARKK